ncbi:MAG: hypothetical protein AB7K24_18130 [Gemmataceae bacterium]
MAKDRREFLAGLQVPSDWNACVFPRARNALQTVFWNLHRQRGRGDVALSAQICPLVVRLANQAGFGTRFVDLSVSGPTPAPESFRSLLDSDVAAIIVSPLYGHLPGDWSVLESNSPQTGRPWIIVDLAQGLGLPCTDSFFHSADAIIYSFGLGKGLDCGGGLLLTNRQFTLPSRRTSGNTSHWGSLASALALRALMAVGVYQFLVSSMDSAIDADKSCDVPIGMELASDAAFSLWQSRLPRFLKEIARARGRSQTLARTAAVAKNCRDLEVYSSARSTHLRQVLRLKDPGARPAILEFLRRNGVDVTIAGEPLPFQYVQGIRPADMPNACMFQNDSIKLPFLGRLSPSSFDSLTAKLEKSFA